MHGHMNVKKAML